MCQGYLKGQPIDDLYVVSAKMVSSIVWHCHLGYISKHGLQVLSHKELLLGYKSELLKFCEDLHS